LIKPGLFTDTAGIALFVIVIIWQKLQVKGLDVSPKTALREESVSPGD